jgi:hypothetical protein
MPETITASGRSPRTWQPQRPTRTVGPSTPRAKLHLARGTLHSTNETPPRSMARRPLGRVPASLGGRTPLGRVSASLKGWTPPRAGEASLEGWTPPRAKLHLARGSHSLAAPATTPPTGVFNVRTHAGAQVKHESAPCRPSDIAWESYSGAVSPTLPVKPSLPLYGIVR